MASFKQLLEAHSNNRDEAKTILQHKFASTSEALALVLLNVVPNTPSQPHNHRPLEDSWLLRYLRLQNNQKSVQRYVRRALRRWASHYFNAVTTIRTPVRNDTGNIVRVWSADIWALDNDSPDTVDVVVCIVKSLRVRSRRVSIRPWRL